MTGSTWCKLSESKWELQQAHTLVEAIIALPLLIPGVIGIGLLAANVMAVGFWTDKGAALLLIAFLLWVSGSCCWLYLWIMFGRCGVMIDKSEERVISWWSLLWLRREKTAELRSFNTVELESHLSKGPPPYKVLLTDSNSWKLVRVIRECDETTAKRLATELAHFLELPCKL